VRPADPDPTPGPMTPPPAAPRIDQNTYRPGPRR
jgi:hypothetical protein